MRATNRPSRPGFTLLELVLVAAIITILSSVAMPRYAAAINNYRATAIARHLAADIDLARSRARATSTAQSIAFLVAQNQYQLVGLNDPDHPGIPWTISLSDPSLPGTLVSAAFGVGTTLTFTGFGVPAAGGVIQSRSGNALCTITVDPDTGDVTFQ